MKHENIFSYNITNDNWMQDLKRKEEIIRCGDCKYWGDEVTEECFINNTTCWTSNEFCSKGEKK